MIWLETFSSMQKSGQIELMQQTHEMSSSSYLLMFTPTERQKVFLISKAVNTAVISMLQLQAWRVWRWYCHSYSCRRHPTGQPGTPRPDSDVTQLIEVCNAKWPHHKSSALCHSFYSTRCSDQDYFQICPYIFYTTLIKVYTYSGKLWWHRCMLGNIVLVPSELAAWSSNN